jgi:hypothetical protein
MTPSAIIDQMQAAGVDAPPRPLKLTGRRVYFGPRKKQWYVGADRKLSHF